MPRMIQTNHACSEIPRSRHQPSRRSWHQEVWYHPIGERGGIERLNMPSAVFTQEQKELLQELLSAGAILTGDIIRERFGLNSPIYIDLREAVYARPELLWNVGREFAKKICDLSGPNAAPQFVVGIPDTATPLALATALYAWQNRVQPTITYAMLRKQGKTYPGLPPRYWIGSREPAAEYNLIDDVVASGLTKRTSAVRMLGEGVRIRRIIVLFDRQQGDGLREEGFELHGIFKVPQVLDFYRDEELISHEDHQRITDFLRRRRFDSPASIGHRL
jgi:orotate phosphoribosyltransferase